MKRTEFEKPSVADLVAQFSGLALAQHEAVETFRTALYNRLYERIRMIESELKARNGDQRGALMPLLDAPNIQVRFMACYALLTIAPERVRETLRQIRETGQLPQSADAGYTLDHFDESIAQQRQREGTGG